MGTAIGLSQTYHERENVITGNVMYLLKMIQKMDACAYAVLLTELFGGDELQDDFDDVFTLQPTDLKSQVHSVPDACVERDSYKIVVETKGNGASFNEQQLERHMKYLLSHGTGARDEYKDHRLLLTLDIDDFPTDLRDKIAKMAKENNVQWRHLKFSDLANLVRQSCVGTTNEILYNIIDEFDDYLNCEGLVPSTAVIMKMVLAGKAHQLNEDAATVDYGVYFHPAERRGYSFNPSASMLGMYWSKSIREIARIQKVAKMVNGDIRSAEVVFPELERSTSDGNGTNDDTATGSKQEDTHLSEGQIAAALKAINKAESEFGWNLRNEPYYVYLTEPFVQTDFPKTSPRAPFGVRLFNLDEELHLEDNSSTDRGAASLKRAKELSTEEIATRLRSFSWQ